MAEKYTLPEDLAWINDKVNKLPKYNGLYIFSCLITGKLFKKLTYKDFYLILLNVYQGRMSITDSKKRACKVIEKLHEFNNKNIENDVN